jgi:uracil-DNA glycosylase
MHESWKKRLADDFRKPYFENIRSFVEGERRNFTVYPQPLNTFKAFEVTSFDSANVLLLGQDPYFNAGEAHGLSFSVEPGTPIPPSLRNIFKEAAEDVGLNKPTHGHLLKWAEQGVLLLNSILTVRAGQAKSHRGIGWERFTDQVIRLLNEREEPVVFVLWGRDAREKKPLIDRPQHTIIESAHPSPMSATNGFFGSKPFSKVNAALEANGQPRIDWQV